MRGANRKQNNFFSNLEFLPLKPLLFGRILKNYFNILIRRKPALRVVTLALDYKCQFFCDYCYAKNLQEEDRNNFHLTASDYERVIRQAMRCGAINFHFSGGEPLLFKDFYKLSALVDPKKNIKSLVTNGFLLEEEAENLKKAGFDLVIVSIDSPRAETHDNLRNFSGAHKKAWSGIDAAKSKGLKVMVAMVATAENLNDGQIEQQIKIARSKGISLQLLPIRPQKKGESKVILDNDDQRKFYKYVSKKGVRWDGQSSYLSARCLAGRERLYISPNGDVFSCDFIQKPFGNLKDEGLFSIWQRMLKAYPYKGVNRTCLSSFDQEFISSIKNQ